MRRRWPRASRAYLAASAALALGAGLMAHALVARAAAATSGLGPQTSVVVAGEPIQRGSSIASDQIRTTRIPAAYAPPGSLHQIGQVAGRVALTDLATGEAVTETRLARVRAGPVASLVPEGLRAFAVPSSLPAGALAPGDRVDILATYSQGQPHTETVVQGVEVLLVLGSAGTGSTGGVPDIEADAGGADGGSGTLLLVLVSPDQEQRLAYARAFADLEVVIAPATA